jgi:protein phosphatase
VAWLRRLGMPLAGIQRVCGLGGSDAAAEICAFWSHVEADTAARRDLVGFLIEHLSRKDAAMSLTGSPLQIRYAALSDAGLVRPSNQDSAFAGPRLLAVADGFGTAGATASVAAIDTLKRVNTDAIESGDLLNGLQDAVNQATEALCDLADTDDPAESSSGTTLTAMLWTGSQLALVHIGDSRAYLLRDRTFFQITHDHTMVQSMLDEGRITPAEAASHPQRSLLVKALDGRADPDPELHVNDVRSGDRYVLCTDGLSAVVPVEEIERVAVSAHEPTAAVQALVSLARGAGGPDNVSCVVADVVAIS